MTATELRQIAAHCALTHGRSAGAHIRIRDVAVLSARVGIANMKLLRGSSYKAIWRSQNDLDHPRRPRTLRAVSAPSTLSACNRRHRSGVRSRGRTRVLRDQDGAGSGRHAVVLHRPLGKSQSWR